MATLTIRKKSLKTWVHQFSDMPENITSKFYFTIDGEYFRIVEIGQEKRNKYRYTDITIIDDVTSTTYDNFSSITELSLQLEALKYPAFQRDYILNTQLIELQDVEVTSVENGQVLVYEDGVWKNQNQSGGSGGSQDLQQTLENGATYTANGKTITIFENGLEVFDETTLATFGIGLGDGAGQKPYVTYVPDAGGQTFVEFPLTETSEEVAYKSYVDTGLSDKVDKVTGKQLSTEDYTTAEKSKLSGIASGATANDTDANLKNRANHTGSQAISTITGLQTFLDGLQRNIIEDVTDRSHTGSLSETIVSNQLISANALKTGTILELDARINRTGTSASATIRYYISPNNNSLTGATQIGITTVTNTQSLPKFTRQFSINSSSVLRGLGGSVSAISDEVNTTVAFLNLSLTLSNNYYLITTVQLNNTSDTITQECVYLKSSR